jgi:hypothetical protein
MRDAAAWQKLNDGKTYKIYDDSDNWLGWLLNRYTVADPDGSVLTCTTTRWGARRAIRKHAIRKHQRNGGGEWWERPIVGEVPR